MWPVAKKAIVIGAVCLAGASRTAYASFSDVLEVNVPFPFMVGDREFPAGRYSVERDSDASGALMIRGEHGIRAAAILNTRPASGPAPGGERPTLQFTRVENQYRLSNVWTGDERSVDVR